LLKQKLVQNKQHIKMPTHFVEVFPAA